MQKTDEYWDSRMNSWAKMVLPGEYDVTDRDDLTLVTLLGSCVAACVRDTERGVGGLNHFLLPEDKGQAGAGFGRSERYGVNAMETLINTVMRKGGRRDRLEAKLFGGGNVLDMSSGESVGVRNVKFARDYMRTEGIRVTGEDLGGDRPRRIFFSPATGKVRVLRLARSDAKSLSAQESKLKEVAAAKPTSGGVELF
jgi:chemotaxis protein CheD